MTQDSQTAPEPRTEPREIELKFLTTESGFQSIQEWPALDPARARRQSQRLLTRYFDTGQGDLERRNMVLRVRKQGRGHFMSVKWDGDFPGGAFERGEVEVPCPTPEPDPALLGPPHAEMLAGILGEQKLIPVYETEIRRHTRRVASESSAIEVAFDTGFIRAGEQKSPIREIELELKSGDPAELYRLGIALAQTYPVRLGMQAKAARAALLRSGKPPEVVRAISPLSGTPSIDEAIGAVINACLAQFTGNFAAFETGDSVSAVHQMRVAMRRLRSILKRFQRSFPCAEFPAFGNQAKRIANTLGEGRNWDVFLELLRDGPAAAFPEERGFAPIFAAAETHRAQAYETIRAMLAAPETTCFVLTVQGFIARHGWRNGLSVETLARLTEPAVRFADANLQHMHAKLLKRGRHLHTLPPHERHRLRIGLKNIRYAADLFSGLFGDHKGLRNFLRHTARLQDQLGAYNDLVTAIGMLDRLGAEAEASHAAGIIAGWCRHGAIPNDDLLLRSWKRFRKAKLASA